MKKLEELGICPAPWKWDGDDERFDDMVLSPKGTVAELMAVRDARLCAAAPDLYEALLEIFEQVEDGDAHFTGARTWLAKARAALEKAGGAE